MVLAPSKAKVGLGKGKTRAELLFWNIQDAVLVTATSYLLNFVIFKKSSTQHWRKIRRSKGGGY